MRTDRIEMMLSGVLREFASMLKIAYAILYKPFRNGPPMLIIRFLDEKPEERFKLRLDLITLLPIAPIDVYDFHSVPRDLLKHVFRYGRVIHIENYDLYMKDLERIFSAR